MRCYIFEPGVSKTLKMVTLLKLSRLIHIVILLANVGFSKGLDGCVLLVRRDRTNPPVIYAHLCCIM